MIIGMSNTEIKNKFQQIVDFADIKDFITAPLYTYSSGMKLRLGFSIAIHSEADIFLLDEVLNLGDQNFRKKLDGVMEKMLRGGATILIISQWEEYLKANCYTMLTIGEK
jgi:ABC-2 type transport system ATP-binding protein